MLQHVEGDLDCTVAHLFLCVGSTPELSLHVIAVLGGRTVDDVRYAGRV